MPAGEIERPCSLHHQTDNQQLDGLSSVLLAPKVREKRVSCAPKVSKVAALTPFDEYGSFWTHMLDRLPPRRQSSGWLVWLGGVLWLAFCRLLTLDDEAVNFVGELGEHE